MGPYLELTADKFTFRVATDRLYTAEGVWVLPEQNGTRLRLGLTDYVQQHSGDVAFAKITAASTTLRAGETFAEIETIKAMIEVQAPVSGKITDVNGTLKAGPEAINQSPYEAGWLAVVEPDAWKAEKSNLLAPEAYFTVMQKQVEEDLKAV